MGAYKIRRSSGAIDREDALTPAETERALAAGAAIAAEEIAAGADLLILGDMGIGNTTPAAALIAATFGVPAAEVTGRGTGIDDAALTGQDRADPTRPGPRRRPGRRSGRPGWRRSDRPTSPPGSASWSPRPGPAYRCCSTASSRWPRLSVAEDLAPGCVAWWAAGHRSTEPAQQLATEKLGLVPLLDLGLRLGEGSGAVAAVPLVRSAALLLSDMALLADLA